MGHKAIKPPLSEECKRDISVSELARLIFRLQKRTQDFINLPDLLEKLSTENSKHNGMNGQSDKEFFLKFYEAVARLKRRGFLMDVLDVMGRFGSNIHHHIPGIGCTSLWEKSSLDDDGWIILVDDAQEIVDSLENEVSNLDFVVKQYYLESLRACQEGLYISSVVCLGAASEKTINCLMQAVIGRHSDHGAKIEKERNISAKIDYLSRNFGQIFSSFQDDTFKREVKDKLPGIAHIYRRNRNEAGHPGVIPMDITRAEQECHLYSFRRYATVIFKAIDMLNSDAHSE